MACKKKKKKKSTDFAIVPGEAGIVFKGKGYLAHEDGSPVIAYQHRKGPMGRSRAGASASDKIGMSKQSERNMQARIVHEADIQLSLAHKTMGDKAVRPCKKLQDSKGRTYYQPLGNTSTLMKRPLKAADGTIVVGTVAGLKGNPAGRAVKIKVK